MTGRERELTDMMEQRNAGILCLQKTKWKGSKASNLGVGCKLIYNGGDGRKNGIGIVLREELAESVRQTNGHEVGGKKVHLKCRKPVFSTG